VVVLEELAVLQMFRKIPFFMQEGTLLLNSQIPTTDPYPEPDESRLRLHTIFLLSHINMFLVTSPGLLDYPVEIKHNCSLS
jgi:hypothetical protein